jgi:hypothetical protein
VTELTREDLDREWDGENREELRLFFRAVLIALVVAAVVVARLVFG